MSLVTHVARTLGLLLGFLVSAVLVGAFGYLVVSFLAMRGHTPARPWRDALRAMFAEAMAVALTQPLIPLFYLVGHRMSGRRSGVPIILVHGYFQNRADFVYLAWAFRRASLGPLYGFNYNWTRGVPTCAAKLAAFVERVCTETGQPKVAIVAHSLGGVVAVEYLATPAGAARVDRCITVASPHAGVVWRAGMIGASARQLSATSEYMKSSAVRPLPIRVVSLFSTHDNIVHPSTTSALTLRGGDDETVDGVGHLSMLFSRKVVDVLVRRLSG